MSATRRGLETRKKRGTVFVHEVQKLVPGKSVRRVEEGGSFFLPSFELPFSDTRRKAFLFEGRGGMAARFIINQVSS